MVERRRVDGTLRLTTNVSYYIICSADVNINRCADAGAAHILQLVNRQRNLSAGVDINLGYRVASEFSLLRAT